MFKKVLVLLLLFLNTLHTFSQTTINTIPHFTIKGVIRDAISKKPLRYATIQLLDENDNFIKGTVTTENGTFTLDTQDNKYTLSISYIGYSNLKTSGVIDNNFKHIIVNLNPNSVELNEVVVTAVESKGTITSSSKIDRKAMEHLQPTSFSDLLALLPGGSSSVPSMTSANTIRLREAGTSNSDYQTSALGTSFIVDGTILNNDANLQSIEQGGSYQDGYRNHKNAGVDMRSLSTDNIEEVEIIRGIPSAAYGDITSGAVIIKRSLSSTPLQARFKADQYGRLFFIGKGMEWKKQQFNLNFDLDYLDSKADPRNLMENYKRINASVRIGKKWDLENYKLNWRANADFRTSIDNDKNDPNITTQQEDKYNKQNQQYSLSNRFTLSFPEKYFIKKFDLNASAALSIDRIKQSKFIQLDRDRVTPNYMEAGEFDGVFLPYKYTAHLTVDGKPVNIAVDAKIKGNGKTGIFSHNFTGGVTYRFDKNYGKGQVYDLSRPLNTLNSTRPRTYSDIPAMEEMSVFAEEQLQTKLGKSILNVVAGVRTTTILNLDSKYDLAGKVLIDPRVNAQFKFPNIMIVNKPLSIDISGGIGTLTKKPTLSYLYPNNYYIDLVQLNYYHTNNDYKRINLKTYIIDPTNYDLKVARNNKWEVRLGTHYDGNDLSVTYFKEKMNSGFRYTTMVMPFTYTKYDTSSIIASELQAPPSLDGLASKQDTILGTYSIATNGSLIDKQGVEFQLSTKRFEKLHTRLTVYGAWFKTIYSNSQKEFDANVTKVIGNVAVNNKYIGLYDWNDGSIVKSFNTNFLFDTYLKKLGLTLSTSFECQWNYSRQTMEKNGMPIGYINTKGEVLPFLPEDMNDTFKQWLVKDYSNNQFAKSTVPFYMLVNLKCTKDFGKNMRISLFVDRIFDYMPSYRNNMGTLVRRSVRPYFGMEMTVKI